MFSSAMTPSVSMPVHRPRSVSPADLLATLSGSCNFGVVLRPPDVCPGRYRSHASKPSTRVYSSSLIHTGSSFIDWPENNPELDNNDLTLPMINEVKTILGSMADGEISISPYDTAWVAFVPNLDGNGGPQFPSSLQWIAANQLPDGSWGDDGIFSANDRMINTLACVVALKSWSICPEKCDKGLLFLRENIGKLAEEDAELMTVGFEVVFPSLLDIAKALGLQVPYDDPSLKDIYAKRELKLQRIPKEVMHEVPTSLLFSLEGMPGLEWDRLLQLRCMDGSFLFSPASTAYALMETKDNKCLKYLQRVVEQFDGGAPISYPVDLFERLWAVDRLERLGISRYFEQEIKECLDYVYRYWTADGIFSARYSRVPDIDDTSMGFRLLRLHGYKVFPDVFRHFKKDGEFVCLIGQSNHAISALYNLNRATQVMSPGEDILEQAKKFSSRILREKQAANQLSDKWIITKDLPGEVEYGLDFPFYASLPRIATRLYLEQYGGSSDVWIAKTLFRMPRVSNDLYLELAKADFNQCQKIHQLEWLGLQKWYKECNLGYHGVSQETLLRAYFLAAACIFEPDRAAERLGWARTSVVSEAIAEYFSNDSCPEEARLDFIHGFSGGDRRSGCKSRVGLLLQLLDQLASSDGCQHQQLQPQLVRRHLKHAWEEWMSSWTSEKEEIDLLFVQTMEICKGRFDLMAHPGYAHLAQLTSSICCRLRQCMRLSKDGNTKDRVIASDDAIESDMQELLQCVLQSSDGLDNQTKQTFLLVVKSCYYATHCSPETLNKHIAKVLFERVA